MKAIRGKPFPIIDADVWGIKEQIEVNGIRNWLSIKGGEEKEGMVLEDFFELTPCNKWVCNICGHTELLGTDAAGNKTFCPSCERKEFVQNAEPIEWLWREMGIPKPCDLFDIYEEIYKFLKQHVVLNNEALYDILIAWLISSWKLHRLDAVAYIQILGTIETGKTRLLELLNELCYHGIMAVTITPAAISRVIDTHGGTILLDQAEKLLRLSTDSGVSMYGICLSGYRRGMKYTTADQNDQTKIISKNVFGPKAFTSERVFDPALTSRCITIRMHRNDPPSRTIDYDWTSMIRRMLLYYRYKFDYWDEGRTILKGRSRELYAPLLRIVESGSRDLIVVENYARQEKASKDAELQTSDTAIILKTILDQLNHCEQQLDTGGEIFISEIADTTLIDPKKIGWRLKNLGIARERNSAGAYIEFTPNVIEHLKQLAFEYGFGKKEVVKNEKKK